MRGYAFLGGSLGMAVARAVAVCVALGAIDAARAQTAWKPYTDTSRRFAVEFPDSAEPRDLSVTAVDGSPLPVHVVSCSPPGAKAAFMVMYSELKLDQPPQDVQPILKAAQEGAEKNVGGKLVLGSDQPVKVSDPVSARDIEGLEFQITAPANVLIRQQCFVVERRVYQLIAATDAADKDLPDVQRFLKSFRLLGPAAGPQLPTAPPPIPAPPAPTLGPPAVTR